MAQPCSIKTESAVFITTKCPKLQLKSIGIWLARNIAMVNIATGTAHNVSTLTLGDAIAICSESSDHTNEANE
jgi:hypothetical protein